MTDGILSTVLVSPVSRLPLMLQGTRLATSDDRESFPVEQEIALLIDREAVDAALLHEMEVFDNLNIQGLSYFRPQLYQRMLGRLRAYLKKTGIARKIEVRFAELGGGEGHCARYLLEHMEQAEAFVCDVSIAALKLAPRSLRRICADITRPIFAQGVLQSAAFWVSLHHLPEERRRPAFEEAFSALDEGGVLIVFEPNDAFFLRRLMYHSKLRRDVYFDDRESAVDFTQIASLARESGFEELETLFLNPPYNPVFVRQLKRWYFYLPVVKVLYLLDLLFSGRHISMHSSYRKYLSLYGMSFFRKPCRLR
ncbi:MAG: class I SAM-dependent methyltransferase [Nitrospirae bacterium]|nr:class I SAM-dependent methyltransferase [Nitrospirota bacterium]